MEDDRPQLRVARRDVMADAAAAALGRGLHLAVALVLELGVEELLEEVTLLRDLIRAQHSLEDDIALLIELPQLLVAQLLGARRVDSAHRADASNGLLT